MSVSIFMFHDVMDPPFECPHRYDSRSFMRVKTAKDRIDYIAKNYHVISLENYLSGKLDQSKKYAILTFDDGTRCQYLNIFPYLKENNLPATFFVASEPTDRQTHISSIKIQFLIGSFHDKLETLKNLIDDLIDKETNSNRQERYAKYSQSLYNGRDNWWSPDEIYITRVLRSLSFTSRNKIFNELDCYVPKNRFYMNREEIKDILSTPGFSIGGHGKFSEMMSTLSPEKRDEEINESAKFLRSLGIKTLLFSYPNGYYDSDIQERVKKAGFVAAVTTKPTNVENSDLFTLPRLDGSQYTFEPKIVLCGVQQQGLEIVNFLKKHGITVTHIITIDEKEAIRQKSAGWIDYTKYDLDGIKLYHAKHYGLKSQEDYEYFHRERFDILILGGWQRLIPDSILRLIKKGAIGQHGSSELLPKNRGRSPINWSILLGKKRIAWNLFFLTPGIDDGDIIDTEVFEINEWDTCKTIYYKVSMAVSWMYVKNIPLILENKLVSKRQNGDITFYKKRTPEDGKINWNTSIYDIYNLIRAVTIPYPGAFTFKNGEKITIWKAQPFTSYLNYYSDKKYGEIVEVFSNKEYVIKGEEGLLLITDSTDPNPLQGEVYN